MTNEQEKAQAAALVEERRGYELRAGRAQGDDKTMLEARIAAVDAQLRRLGAKGDLPHKRAEKRAPKGGRG